MSWRARLQPGKFRDAGFLIESDETTLGRRTVLHEYPLRDTPFAEDLGRRHREFTIECFVLGADYMTARDALMKALETEGPGTLVHPYLGVMRVSVKDARKRETTAEGGKASFSITFVEAGENIQPAAAPATGVIVGSRADDAVKTTKSVFDKVFSIDKKPKFVADAALELLKGALSRIGELSGSLTGAPAEISSTTALLDQLVQTPGDLSSVFTTSIGRLADTYLSPADALKALKRLAEHGSSEPAVPTTTPSRRAQADNQEAVLALTQRTALIEAARVSADLDFASYDDAAGERDDLVARLDGHIDVADDESYVALTELKVAVVRDINARGANLARVIDYTPAETLPALVLSHRLYGDASREAEIVDRNRVRHPGFVPGGRALEVLTNA